MIEENGRVIAVENNLALIEIQRTAVCNACAENRGCGAGVLSKVMGNKRFRVTAHNTINAGVGDEVIVGIDDNTLVKSSFVVYIIPLLLLFVGAWCGQSIAAALALPAAEGISILFGMLGLFAGFLWLRHFTQKINKDNRYRPVILKCRQPLGISTPAKNV